MQIGKLFAKIENIALPIQFHHILVLIDPEINRNTSIAILIARIGWV